MRHGVGRAERLSGTHGSEGRPPQQCGGPTRREDSRHRRHGLAGQPMLAGPKHFCRSYTTAELDRIMTARPATKTGVRTREMSLYRRYFDLVAHGTKTIEVRVQYPNLHTLKAGAARPGAGLRRHARPGRPGPCRRPTPSRRTNCCTEAGSCEPGAAFIALTVALSRPRPGHIHTTRSRAPGRVALPRAGCGATCEQTWAAARRLAGTPPGVAVTHRSSAASSTCANAA